MEIVLEQLIEPFFDRGLATAASDTNHRNVAETTAVEGGQRLQGIQGVVHHQEVGTEQRQRRHVFTFHHKIANTSVVEPGYIVVPIVIGCVQGKEQGVVRHGQGPRVGEQFTHRGLAVEDAAITPQHFRYFLYGIFHK